jgi:hypothetical protein
MQPAQNHRNWFFQGLQAFSLQDFRPSGPSGLQQFFLWLSPVPGLESGVWLSLEWVASSQSWAERPLPPPGRRVTADRLLTTHKLVQKVYECDNVTMWRLWRHDNNNERTEQFFPVLLQELQCNCSATHWPCIRIVSVLQHNCKYSFSVYPFITTPPAGACSEGEKKKACRRAVRSVCDCIMFSFSVVCDRYTNTSVTVTVTVTESLL